MTHNVSKLLTAVAFSAIALTLTACNKDNATTATDTAASTAVDDVATRQALMKDWGAASEIIKGMVEDPSRFDSAVLQEQTKFLADSSSQMWTHFANEANKGKSQDAVWTDAAGFKAAADKFNAAVANLNTVAQTAQSADDIGAALGQVGESCGSCHKVFKK